ncbi:DNA-cytosine methyltransferase [Nostoc phage A1]|nr:DNA-cytosine methyltransferase [Nostoc phage A1]
MKPIAISLFTGVGGFDLGVERAGFNVVAANEIDVKTASTYSKNFKTPIIDDVRRLSGNVLRDSGGIGNRDVDLVFGGSPCQGFSQAGCRNESDSRNLLIFEYQRIVLDIYPKYFIFENVSELLNRRNESLLNRFISGFNAEGYRIALKVLDASNYGIPQSRKRVFMLGCRYDRNAPQYPPESEQRFTLHDAIADLKFANGYEKLKYVDRVPEFVYDEPSNYVKNYHKLLGSNIDFTKVIRPITASKFTRHDYQTIKDFSSYSQGYREKFGRRLKPIYNDVCPTVVTKQRLIHPIYPRYLTVRECARVQSFPDDFNFYTTIEQGQKEVGNAVPPLLGFQLAKEVLKVL